MNIFSLDDQNPRNNQSPHFFGATIKGFSLVELSIVLLIISLIVAGIMLGRQLIEQAEIKTVIAKVNETKSGLTQFKEQYNQLPGDMSNATAYWSDAANGNGNGEIASEPSNEAFMVFDHLVRGGFIKGNYTGAWGTTGFVASSNVMELESRNAALYVHCCSSSDYTRNLEFNNHVTIFSIYSDPMYRAGILTPIESFSLDEKLDDGNPDTGFVGASGGYDGAVYSQVGCYTGEAEDAVYEAANEEYQNQPTCQVHFAYDW